MAKTVFSRVEKKYLLTEEDYQNLRMLLSEHMNVDQYGRHTICNIYYDTPDSLLIRRSIEKPVYKEKLRLRSYGVPEPDSTVFLEIKKKHRKVVNKRRIALTLNEAYDYLEKGIRPQKECQILREIDFFIQRYDLKKALFLAYDRVALYGKEDSEFRVTFDTNIRSRAAMMNLENGDYGNLLMPAGFYLMETKVMGSTPLWFTHILSQLKIYPANFSKYGNVYKKSMGAFDMDSLLDRLNESRIKDAYESGIAGAERRTAC